MSPSCRLLTMYVCRVLLLFQDFLVLLYFLVPLQVSCHRGWLHVCWHFPVSQSDC
jgi:hypothetical protein